MGSTWSGRRRRRGVRPPSGRSADQVGPVRAAERVAAAGVVGLGEAVSGFCPPTVERCWVTSSPLSAAEASNSTVGALHGPQGRRAVRRSYPRGRAPWSLLQVGHEEEAALGSRRTESSPTQGGASSTIGLALLSSCTQAKLPSRPPGRGSATDRDGRSHAAGSGPAAQHCGDTGCRRRTGRCSPRT